MRWMDRAYLRFAPRLGCFEDGWGEPALLERPLEGHAEAPHAARIRWTRARSHGVLRIVDGVLTSPDELLPPESRLARVRWLKPREGEPRALTVVLASWGDEGWGVRQRVFGPAAAAGVSCLLLECPFYGNRRRIGQRGAKLRSVSDFFLMGRASLREAFALLGWAREQGIERVGVAGYSMGGQMTAMAGALAPWPIYTVAMAPSVTPASVFIDGPLHRDLAWHTLGPDGPDRLRAVLATLSVTSLPPLADPVRATLLGARSDEIVPPRDIEAIGQHWRVSPRWLDDGHVSAITLRAHALAQAVVDTFSR